MFANLPSVQLAQPDNPSAKIEEYSYTFELVYKITRQQKKMSHVPGAMAFDWQLVQNFATLRLAVIFPGSHLEQRRSVKLRAYIPGVQQNICALLPNQAKQSWDPGVAQLKSSAIRREFSQATLHHVLLKARVS